MQDLGRASGNGFPVSLWDLHRAHMPVGAQQSVHSGSTLSAEREAEHRGGERQEGNTLGSENLPGYVLLTASRRSVQFFTLEAGDTTIHKQNSKGSS